MAAFLLILLFVKQELVVVTWKSNLICRPQKMEVYLYTLTEPSDPLAKFTTYIQSTLVISKSKGPSKTVRDIRTSTYQICSIEEKTI